VPLDSTSDPQPPNPQSSDIQLSDSIHQSPLESIQSSVALLAKTVTDLTTRQATQVKRARRWALIALCGLVLDVVLTASVGYLTTRANHNANNISHQQTQIEQVTTTIRTEGICPLYDITLTGYDPKSPNAIANPVRYEARFKSYEVAATKFGCVHHTRGPLK
jgi:hypothetical protein